MNDKFIALTPAIYQYLEPLRTDSGDALLQALREETAALGGISGMQIAPEQGTFLQMLATISGARNALEIGTFTGYSSVCIARGLGPGGKLRCLDQSGEWTQIAQRYWQQAGLHERIELHLGDARQTLPRLTAQNPAPFDFVFIDADKEAYDWYYETVLPHCAAGAVMIFDNMLRGGNVAKAPETLDDSDKAIDALNRKLTADTRVESVLLPIADGLNICRKR
jgi:caffeoyl-CoA O-methyltransferase